MIDGTLSNIASGTIEIPLEEFKKQRSNDELKKLLEKKIKEEIEELEKYIAENLGEDLLFLKKN